MNNLIVLLALLVSIFSFSNNCFASDDYYAQHAIGWHWYDDPEKQEKIKTIPSNPSNRDPNAIIDAARKKITTALNKVIAEPTVANLKEYIKLQEELSNRAEQVSNLWEQVLLQNPQLNYALVHPTNNVALQVYHEKESGEKESVIKQFANQMGLFFFYRSTCPYCKRFAPIVKNFAERNGLRIIPITMDGIPLPEFPESKRDTGQAAQFHVTVTPSLFAVNPYTQKAFPIAYGLTSETEIRDNIYKAMTQQAGRNQPIEMRSNS